MACRLFGDNPLSEPMIIYCQLDLEEYISMKNFHFKLKSFHSRKSKYRCRLQKRQPFCLGLYVLTSSPGTKSLKLKPMRLQSTFTCFSTRRARHDRCGNEFEGNRSIASPNIIKNTKISCHTMGYIVETLHWRHNDHDGVSNHQPHGCLLNHLFRRRSKKTPKLRVTGLCVGNSPEPVNSPHKGPVSRKMFPFDDVIMMFTELAL